MTTDPKPPAVSDVAAALRVLNRHLGAVRADLLKPSHAGTYETGEWTFLPERLSAAMDIRKLADELHDAVAALVPNDLTCLRMRTTSPPDKACGVCAACQVRELMFGGPARREWLRRAPERIRR